MTDPDELEAIGLLIDSAEDNRDPSGLERGLERCVKLRSGDPAPSIVALTHYYLTDERIRLLTRVAPLHDIGKVGIPDAVLNKPGPLTLEEIREIRKHPELGYWTILRAEEAAGLTGEWTMEALTLAKELVRFHHECWDGTGYPHGLSGEEIPVPARIMAVVDVYDAMVQTRVYRRAGSHDEAREAIEAGRGTTFDPQVVDAFLEVEGELHRRTAAYQGQVREG